MKLDQLDGCTFCCIKADRIIDAHPFAVVVRDAFPVNAGHSLIIPRRHVTSFFETTLEEREAILALLDRTKNRIDKERRPDGYNIGINDGAAAGQTVMHLHVHLIPRYQGDVPDPRGGVRWIFPDKAAYWDKE